MEKHSSDAEYASDMLGMFKINRGPKFGERHWQMTLLFLMMLVTYLMRVMMSLSIVAMTDPTSSSNPDVPTYQWSNTSLILSAYFWGYVIPQLVAGWMANRYGPKWILVISGGICALVGLAVPFTAATFGSYGVMVCRIVQGACQGFIFPCVHYLLAEWSPLNERSRLSTFVYGGTQLGTVGSMFITGLISSSSYGWPLAFYTFSGAGLIWCILYAYYGSNSPNVHSSINEHEKKYIVASTGITIQEKKITPWCDIATSVPVWAMLAGLCGMGWTFELLVAQVPNYMNKVLNLDMEKNTVLTPLPYVVLWFLCVIMSFISDFVISRKVLSLGNTRKLFSAIGCLVPAGALLVLGNCDSSKPLLAYILLVIAVGGVSGAYVGFFVNQLDLAPNHAGTLMGIVNGIATCFSVLSTTACQYVVKDETNPAEWKTMFYLSSGLMTASCLAYVIFGSGEVQSWNNTDNENRQEKE